MTSLRNHNRSEFPQAVRKAAFRRACVNGEPYCESCGKFIRAGHLIFEHVQADGLGGEPTHENCMVHCSGCAGKKTIEEDNPRMVKADAVLKATYGIKPAKRNPMPGSRASGIRKRFNGRVERR